MNKNVLKITMIFDASSANYGESIGNISQLKKMTRKGGESLIQIFLIIWDLLNETD